MKTQLTKTKINGHGYKKGRVWNLAHLLPKRRLALLPDGDGVAEGGSVGVMRLDWPADH